MFRKILLAVSILLLVGCSNGESPAIENEEKDNQANSNGNALIQNGDIPTSVQESTSTISSLDHLSETLEPTVDPPSENYIDEESIGTIPDDAYKILAGYMSSGGGGANQCWKIAPSEGFNHPIIDERFTDMGQIVYPIKLDIATCGWDLGEKVKINVEFPSGEINSSEVEIHEDFGGLDYEFYFPLNPEYGMYRFTFIGKRGTIDHPIELVKPSNPIAYFYFYDNYSQKKLVLSGFSPSERVYLYFYEVRTVGEQNKIVGAKEFIVGDDGHQVIDIKLLSGDYQYLIEGKSSGLVYPQAEFSNFAVEYIPDTTIGSDFLCDYDSEFVTDVTILDGTTMAPGEKFEKIWKLKNTSSCVWLSNTKIYLTHYDGPTFGAPTRILLPYDIFPVEPGESVDIPVMFTAPQEEGKYRSQWQLMVYQGSYDGFGRKPFVEIIVESSD